MTTERIELTDAGRRFAENHKSDIVPNVALQGYDSSWPELHVTCAIQACNEMGKGERKTRESDLLQFSPDSDGSCDGYREGRKANCNHCQRHFEEQAA